VKIVLVEWEDSAMSAHWQDKECFKDKETARATSVGFRITEDDKKLTIIQSIGEAEYQGAITIPKGCIKRIRQLKVK
jgi:hypothetical protein